MPNMPNNLKDDVGYSVQRAHMVKREPLLYYSYKDISDKHALRKRLALERFLIAVKEDVIMLYKKGLLDVVTTGFFYDSAFNPRIDNLMEYVDCGGGISTLHIHLLQLHETYKKGGKE